MPREFLISTHHDPSDLGQFQEWLTAEWGHVDPLVSNNYPQPILAKIGAEQLAGGLAFTQAPHPDLNTLETWINVLYVSPEYRRSGIAQCLISKAEILARERGINRLFVHTEIPDMYTPLGWTQVGEHHQVLTKGIDA